MKNQFFINTWRVFLVYGELSDNSDNYSGRDVYFEKKDAPSESNTLKLSYYLLTIVGKADIDK